MQVSIVKNENMVVVGGVGLLIDCSAVSPIVHAIQWNDEAKIGHIEFAQTPGKQFVPNIKIVEFGDYEYLREAWQARQREIETAATEVEAKRAALDAATAAHQAAVADQGNIIASADASGTDKAAAVAAIQAANDQAAATHGAFVDAVNALQSLRSTPGKAS